jgi:hypothetical protein
LNTIVIFTAMLSLEIVHLKMWEWKWECVIYLWFQKSVRVVIIFSKTNKKKKEEEEERFIFFSLFKSIIWVHSKKKNSYYEDGRVTHLLGIKILKYLGNIKSDVMNKKVKTNIAIISIK